MDSAQFQCVATATRAFYTCNKEYRESSETYKLPCDAISHHVYIACMREQNKNIPQEKNGRN
jgi:hypothetical protein